MENHPFIHEFLKNHFFAKGKALNRFKKQIKTLQNARLTL
jgi:hypothetical protein